MIKNVRYIPFVHFSCCFPLIIYWEDNIRINVNFNRLLLLEIVRVLTILCLKYHDKTISILFKDNEISFDSRQIFLL